MNISFQLKFILFILLLQKNLWNKNMKFSIQKNYNNWILYFNLYWRYYIYYCVNIKKEWNISVNILYKINEFKKLRKKIIIKLYINTFSKI